MHLSGRFYSACYCFSFLELQGLFLMLHEPRTPSKRNQHALHFVVILVFLATIEKPQPNHVYILCDILHIVHYVDRTVACVRNCSHDAYWVELNLITVLHSETRPPEPISAFQMLTISLGFHPEACAFYGFAFIVDHLPVCHDWWHIWLMTQFIEAAS